MPVLPQRPVTDADRVRVLRHVLMRVLREVEWLGIDDQRWIVGLMRAAEISTRPDPPRNDRG
jgi:hypothetical protein